MIKGNIIFGGGGSTSPAMLAWSNPDVGSKPRVLSEFQQGYSVYALAISPNGQRIAAGTKAGLVRVHSLDDAHGGEQVPALFEVFHQPGVFGLAFCTDDVLATGGYDGRIKVWSVSQQRQLGEITAHEDGVYALRQIGSLVLASIGGDGVLRVWDMDSIEVRYESEPFALPRIHGLTSLDYHAGLGLLMHPSRSGDLHVYDVKNDFEVRVIPAHRGDFCAMAAGHDLIATAGMADPIVKVWPPSFDGAIAETPTPSAALSIGWVAERTLMLISDDGCGQLWKVGDVLHPGARFEGCDLRTVAGLPGELLARRQASMNRQWRDGKLDAAKELMGQPDKQRELGAIVDELNQRGFSVESALLLADTAKAQSKPLRELEVRLAVAERLGEAPVAAPTLYALGELLETLKEPALAEQYFAKAMAAGDTHADAQDRIDGLQAHPLCQICAETHVRADLMAKDAILREIEKAIILKRKFYWRCALTKAQPMRVDVDLDAREVTDTVRDVLAKHGVDKASSGLRQDLIFDGNRMRAVKWVYVPSDEGHPGVAFALGVQSTTRGSEVTPYGIFDPSLLGIAQNATPHEHNQRVKGAWVAYVNSPESRQWLREAEDLARKCVSRLASKAVAVQDDEF